MSITAEIRGRASAGLRLFPRIGVLSPPAPKVTYATLGIIGLLILLALWWGATDLLAAEGSFARRFSPALTLPALARLVSGAELWLHISVSLKRVLVGLRSEEHTSELQSRGHLVCRLLLEKKTARLINLCCLD